MITDVHFGYWTKRKVRLAPDILPFIGFECSECHYISLIKGEKVCCSCKAIMSERIKDEDQA